ncbi:hypothetical protein [Kitasatospora sp. NPDC088548]|uniref:hypothetical protein n=1 Tax=Kitasatospora sp. NPDC088548 TaxID=3364075 RepID=UPI0037FEECB7
MMFRSGCRGAVVIVDPGLPTKVQETVRMVAAQHPQVLRDPGAPLPRTAGFDHSKLAVGARGVLITVVMGAVLVPGMFWLMPKMLTALEPGRVPFSPYIKPVIVSVIALAVVTSIIMELLRARVDGGRGAVARDLAEARSRYLLPGTHLDRTAWASAARAQRALAGVAVGTSFLTSVDRPDHAALAKGFWTLAQDMARSRSTAAMDSFAAAVEVYITNIEAADAISLTRDPVGEANERHDRAIERANAAGRHAIAMTTAT